MSKVTRHVIILMFSLAVMFLFLTPFAVAILVLEEIVDQPIIASQSSIPKAYVDQFLGHCFENLHDDCGTEVVLSLYQDEEMSEYCCGILIESGRSCHDEIVTMFLRDKPKSYANKVLIKSSQLWKNCSIK
uniref:uncharacterized protein LOC105351602 n=1 Tax=Fragaria vesca subsp. vesca TaxID=101020 RepID=UPI0005C86FE4|nr:PREDICTED: uncharacterized protein LOC105351602 [Fragaria vesca subsp. vesca]